MTGIRRDLPALPVRMLSLKIDDRGYPVPFFVAWVDVRPDHRIVDPHKMVLCLNKSVCWLCGDILGTHKAFVAGPMCVINRTSAEPPSHLECAEFAVRACPFMTRPMAKRRVANMPEELMAPAGMMIERNPGVTAIYVTRSFTTRVHDDKPLITMGVPTDVTWWAEGRWASREEVMHSIETGIPILENLCFDDKDRDELATFKRQALLLLPA